VSRAGHAPAGDVAADGVGRRFPQWFDLRLPIHAVGFLPDHAKPLDPAQDDVGSPILQRFGVADQSCAADRVDRGRLLDIVTPPPLSKTMPMMRSPRSASASIWR
jgi:hypothetical protein